MQQRILVQVVSKACEAQCCGVVFVGLPFGWNGLSPMVVFIACLWGFACRLTLNVASRLKHKLNLSALFCSNGLMPIFHWHGTSRLGVWLLGTWPLGRPLSEGWRFLGCWTCPRACVIKKYWRPPCMAQQTAVLVAVFQTFPHNKLNKCCVPLYDSNEMSCRGSCCLWPALLAWDFPWLGDSPDLWAFLFPDPFILKRDCGLQHLERKTWFVLNFVLCQHKQHFASCTTGRCRMFITNFTHSLPWNKFLASVPWQRCVLPNLILSRNFFCHSGESRVKASEWKKVKEVREAHTISVFASNATSKTWKANIIVWQEGKTLWATSKTYM